MAPGPLHLRFLLPGMGMGPNPFGVRAGGRRVLPPRPGHHRDGHLKNGGSPRSEAPSGAACLGCPDCSGRSGSGGLLASPWGGAVNLSEFGSCCPHGGEGSGLFGGFGSGVEIELHVLGPFRPVEPGREVVEVICLVLGIHVRIGPPVRTPTPISGLAALGFVVFVVGDDRVAGGGLLYRPASSVDAAVVEPAQQDQVLGVRVKPPSAQCVMWCASVQAIGSEQPDQAQPSGCSSSSLRRRATLGRRKARPSSTASPVA